MTRQSEHHARLQATGWRRKTVFLSPEAVGDLAQLVEHTGLSEAQVIRDALKHYRERPYKRL